MAASITGQIHEAEEKWLKVLFNQCRSYFLSVHVPSHDEYHHYRVWYYTKQLILNLHAGGIEFSEKLIEKIIISVFFHDAGMSMTQDENHGKAGADLFNIFIPSQTDRNITDHEDIYRTIMQHDQKNYNKITFDQAFNHTNILLSVVTISDDLDAFGYIGAYRYLEIYLMRGIQPEMLADKVIMNLQNRFNNICYTLEKTNRFLDNHRSRYQHTLNFFLDLKNKGFLPDNRLSGPSGILKLVKEMVIRKKLKMQQLINLNDTFNHDEYIRNFLQHYEKEEDLFASYYPGE